MAEFRLVYEMLPLSVHETWDKAKYEWELEDLYYGDSICLCGKDPIKNICVLKNKLNDKRCEVGNVCVKRFTDLPSDLIFRAIKRISKRIDNLLNIETTSFAFGAGWINEYEFKFYDKKYKKRTKKEKPLTDNQIKVMKQINQKVLDRVSNGRNYNQEILDYKFDSNGNVQKNQESKPKSPSPILKVQKSHEINCQEFVPN